MQNSWIVQKRVGLLDVRKTRARTKTRTAEIVVGKTYFLSSFYDVSGANVEVLEVSTDINKAGWASTITVKVLEAVGQTPGGYYTPGKVITVNACNLHESREDASPARKFGK